jgi:iron complex transport system ATP-binding protein
MILKLADVSFQYNSAPVLANVSFQVRRHGITAVLGPNGAGKTTLLRCINRILKPKTGTVLIEDLDLAHAPRREVAKLAAYVAQRSEPGRITAFDAVLLGRKPYIQWNAVPEDIRRTRMVLQRLSLESLALRYVDEMSGGEYQKICIARALVQEPAVMLLDEPTSSLDLKNQLAILRLLRDVVKGQPMCALISMHDLNTALRYADQFIFLKDGVVMATVDRAGITEGIIEAVYGVAVSISWHQGHPVILPLDEE